MAEPIDWPPRRPKRGRGRLVLALIAAAFFLSAGTTLSYYVEALWFSSLGYADVFWKTLNLQSTVLILTAGITFVILYGAFRAMKPDDIGSMSAGSRLIINGQAITLPVEPVLRLVALVASILISLVTGFGMMSEWPTLALYWYGRDAVASTVLDPIFGRPIAFYLFTLPALDLIVGWLTTVAVIVCGVAIFFIAVGGGVRVLDHGR